MNYRIKSKGIVLSFIAATILGLTGIALAGEFSADIKGSTDGSSFTGKIYVKGINERLEESDQKSTDVTIINIDKGFVWMLAPANKTYEEGVFEKNTPKYKSAFDRLKKLPNFKRIGSEEISGYICDKYTYKDTRNKTSGIVYFSPQLDYGLKWDVMMEGHKESMVLSNIKVEPQNDSLFTIPAGYKKVIPTSKTTGKLIVHDVKAKQKHPAHK